MNGQLEQIFRSAIEGNAKAFSERRGAQVYYISPTYFTYSLMTSEQRKSLQRHDAAITFLPESDQPIRLQQADSKPPSNSIHKNSFELVSFQIINSLSYSHRIYSAIHSKQFNSLQIITSPYYYFFPQLVTTVIIFSTYYSQFI